MIKRILKTLNDHAEFVSKLLTPELRPIPIKLMCTKCNANINYIVGEGETPKHYCETREL